MYSESRKRRKDDDENDMEMEEGAKQRRMPDGEDIGPKLVDMIKKLDMNLNDTPVESAIEELANTLEANLDPYEGQIIHILYECAAYLPEKITIFSTLVGIINSKSPEFGEGLIAKFMDEFHDTFMKTDYHIAVRLATFLCDLGNAQVITPGSILEFLEDFVDLANDENIKSDFFIYLVLHTLPWVGPKLNEKVPTKLTDMLDRVSLYLNRRRKSHTQILQVWSNPEFPQQDYLDSLWAQLKKLQENNWQEQHILRTYTFFESILNTSRQHELPGLEREVLKNSKDHPLPRVVFRLFDPSDCPDDCEIILPATNAIERFLVEEDLGGIIDNNYLDWKLCARALLNYHRRETVPLNYVVIETIFGQLFRLPSPPHLELFYGALLIELCRSQADSMPQVLALTAELLYQRVDTMQPTCLDRFINWFSYHLSNFEYRWSWGDWAESVELDSLHPKKIFVREVIEKCLRLSYYKKLSEILPSEFNMVIPDEPTITYVLDDDQHPAFEKAEQMRELIMRKVGDEEMLATLSSTNEEENTDELTDLADAKMSGYSPDAVAVFFSALLKLASKTLTHAFAALTRYHKTLTTLTANNEAMQSTILRTLYDAWILHKQMLSVLVDKMIKMRILDPAIVQAWVFSEEMKIEFKRSWVWDVLSSAIDHLERQRSSMLRRLKSSCAILERLQCQKKGSSAGASNAAEATAMEAAGAEPQPTEANNNGTGATEESSRPKIMAPKKPREEEEEQMDLELDESGWEISRISKLNEQIQSQRSDLECCDENLRNVLLNICHKFTLIITEHLVNCETDGTEIESNFYNYVIGRFKYVFLRHKESMRLFTDDLDRELFSSPTIGARIREVFEQFRSLHTNPTTP